jgi:release factor glutamine methyltransferase
VSFEISLIDIIFQMIFQKFCFFKQLNYNLKLYVLSKLTGLTKEEILVKNIESFNEKILDKAERIAKSHLLNQKPLSKIFGEKYFYYEKFKTNRHTLDPRSETELMVEHALSLNFESFLDLGTGTGAIAISLLKNKKNLNGYAIDISSKALKIAKKNVLNFNIKNLFLLQQNWLNEWNQPVDLLISNPPYLYSNEIKNELKFDPKFALLGSDNNGKICKNYIHFYTEIKEKIHLFKYIFLEINPNDQKIIQDIFPTAKFENYYIFIKN